MLYKILARFDFFWYMPTQIIIYDQCSFFVGVTDRAVLFNLSESTRTDFKWRNDHRGTLCGPFIALNAD